MDRWSSPMGVENRLWAYLCAALPGSFFGWGWFADSVGVLVGVSVGDLVSGWFGVGARKKNEDHGKVLAAQAAAALTHECLHRNQKTLGITLDTADFVRHVPGVPRVSVCPQVSRRVRHPHLIWGATRRCAWRNRSKRPHVQRRHVGHPIHSQAARLRMCDGPARARRLRCRPCLGCRGGRRYICRCRAV